MQHHAFVLEAPAEEGIAFVEAWLAANLGLVTKGNPDVVTYRFGLFSVEDVRAVSQAAGESPLVHDSKAVIIAAARAYHEAQNALLKLFEEPPEGTYLFLILPSLGGLLPTLRSRVHALKHEARSTKHEENPAEEFLKATREKRSVIVKRLASGKDEDARRENRDHAIALLNGIEAYLVQHQVLHKTMDADTKRCLEEISLFRSYLHDRSAPVKMILEHVAIVTPRIP